MDNSEHLSAEAVSMFFSRMLQINNKRIQNAERHLYNISSFIEDEF